MRDNFDARNTLERRAQPMSYTVRLTPSGDEFDVAPTETVLAAAQRHGLPLAYSCRSGACGMCKARLLSGSIDYGDYEAAALSEAERRAGLVLLCQARPHSDLVVEARVISAARGIAIKIVPCRVARMRRLAPDVMELALKLPQGERFEFLAGQYIDILLRDGGRRSFSLANAPHAAGSLELHVRHLPGGRFSGEVFGRMRERDLLRFQGPLGTFFLRADSARPALLIAGGTGFAPIKSIVEEALARGAKRRMHLYWGVRTRRDLYLADLARAWVDAQAGFRYTPVLSAPQPGDDWQGRSGWVHEAVLGDYRDLCEHEVYAAGPPAMIAAIRASFLARGLSPERLYYDSFEPAHADREAGA